VEPADAAKIEAEDEVGETAVQAGPTPSSIDDAERARREAGLNELLDLMRPAVQADGGDLVLTDLDVERGIVEVQLQGACGSCAISGMTLQGGVERLLRQRLDWVTEVRGSVDESLDFFESVSLGRGGYVPRS
jgi:Fe-S cluster biogenesis protein NfuA